MHMFVHAQMSVHAPFSRTLRTRLLPYLIFLNIKSEGDNKDWQ